MTTLPQVAAVRHGDHLCLPYESEAEHQTAVVAFLRDGLAHDQRCMFIGSAGEHAEIVAALHASGVAASRALERGALLLVTPHQTYLRTGAFNPDDMLGFIDELIDGALAAGFTGFRGTGEVGGALSEATWRKIVRYEAQINERFSRRPFVGLCRYQRAAVPPEHVRDLLRTHPIALVRGQACANPFYERPELALSEDPGARIDWQLRQLRLYQRTRQHLEGMAAAAASAAGSLVTENQTCNAAVDELRAAVSLRDHFLTALADQLSASLAALRVEVQALRGHASQPPTDDDAPRLERATRELKRLSEAADRAREVARLVGGQLTLEELDLSDVVRQVTLEHREALATAGCALSFRAQSRVRGTWDRGRIQQIASTLLMNAIARGPGLPVVVEVGGDDHRATLSVCDGGPAVSSGQAADAQLSLSIARELTAGHGGRLSHTNQPPGGVRYTVDLPRTPRRPPR